MSAPLTLAPVPAPSSPSTATPVSSTASPSETTAAMNSPTTPNSTSPTSNSNTSTTSNSNNSDGSATAPSKRKASRRANTAERRATHNAVERQRRETLNGRFLDLAALLPNLATVRRPSKSAIVNSSIALIHSHRRARAAAGRELRSLEEETQALRREVNEWRARTALPALQAPQRSAEFMALLHAGEADDEGAAAEEERRAYLLAGQGGVEDDEEEWDANPIPNAPSGITQQQQQAQQQQHTTHTQSVGPAQTSYVVQPNTMMMEEKMAQWNALQYAMQMQGMHHGHGNMAVGPDPRMAMALQAQRPDHPQWSATAPPHTPTTPGGPTLFARPVPVPQHSHSHSHSFSGPFAFGVPPLNTNGNNNGTTFNTAGYLSTSPGAGGNGVVGSPTGSTPPATTSSSFEDAGTESEGEHGMHGINMMGMNHGGMNHGGMNKWIGSNVRTGGPGGFAAMGMGVVI